MTPPVHIETFADLADQFTICLLNEAKHLFRNYGAALDDQYQQERARLLAFEEEMKVKEEMLNMKLETQKAELKEKEQSLNEREASMRILKLELEKKSAREEKSSKELQELQEKVGDLDKLKKLEKALHCRAQQLEKEEEKLKSEKEKFASEKEEFERKQRMVEDKRSSTVEKERALDRREKDLDEKERALRDLLVIQEKGLQVELEKLKRMESDLARKERELEQKASAPAPAASPVPVPSIDVGWIGLLDYIDSLITDPTTSRDDRIHLSKTRRLAQTIRDLTKSNLRIRLKRILEVDVATLEGNYSGGVPHAIGKVHGPTPFDALRSVTSFLRNFLLTKSASASKGLTSSDNMSETSSSTFASTNAFRGKP